MSDKKNHPERGLYLRILRYSAIFWPALVLGVVGNALYSGIDASLTYFLKPLLNKGFIAKDQAFIVWLPAIVCLIFLLRSFTNFLGSYYMTYVARSIVLRFRQDLFDHLLKIPATYYDNSSSGQILSVMLYNVEQVAKVGADSLTDLVQSFFLIIGYLVVMFTISWRLSLIYFVTIPFIALVTRLSTKYVRKINHAIQRGMGKVTSIAEETIVGYKVVRAFGGQDYERNKFLSALEDNRRRELHNVAVKSISVSLVQFVAAIALAIIIFYATHATTSLSAGGFVALVASMLAILRPLKVFNTVNSTIQRGLAGAQSVFALLDDVEEKDTGTRVVERVQGLVHYQQVSFTYPNTDREVLHDINFTMAPGTTTAVVGRSGSGKSTLVSLLPRFYDCQSGQILLDDYPLQDYQLSALRQQMAIVTQNVTLFNDTIANNIAYGLLRGASEQEIIAAAKAAHAWEFIEQLNEGIHTLIGENGVLLSGGQRQRIAIARAILRNAPLLILDEATSALDTESERYIQAALQELMKDRTTIVIAHRLSTIENAHQILVMDEGRIVEVGHHQQLLALQGYYAKLHAMQFGEAAGI